MKLYWSNGPNKIDIDGSVKVVTDIKPLLNNLKEFTSIMVVDAFKDCDGPESASILHHLLRAASPSTEITIIEIHMELLCSQVGADQIPYDISMPMFNRKSFLPLNFVIKSAQQNGWAVDSCSLGQVIDPYHYCVKLKRL
jgi:hypothetical protein